MIFWVSIKYHQLVNDRVYEYNTMVKLIANNNKNPIDWNGTTIIQGENEMFKVKMIAENQFIAINSVEVIKKGKNFIRLTTNKEVGEQVDSELERLTS